MIKILQTARFSHVCPQTTNSWMLGDIFLHSHTPTLKFILNQATTCCFRHSSNVYCSTSENCSQPKHCLLQLELPVIAMGVVAKSESIERWSHTGRRTQSIDSLMLVICCLLT